MKCIYTIIILCIITTHHINAQSLELKNITVPFSPGERLLSFSVDDQLQSQYYIFYSNNRNDLNNISLNNANNIPYGSAIKYEGEIDRESKLEFVFPGTSTPKGPNAHYYMQQERRQGINFKGPRYITNNDQLILARVNGFANRAFDSDKNERVFRKECMFFRVLEINNYANINRASRIQEFYMPDDFTIGFAGDSFAAGTGADINPSNACYRSNKSGQMLAVKKFIRKNPNVSVSYFHSACNGARTPDLFSDNQTGNDGIQFTMIQNWLDQNNFDELNLLVMNIGGNNVDFADIVEYYYVRPGNFDGSIDQDLMPQRFENLEISYSNLEVAINAQFPFVSTAITTLPKVTRNSQNDICCDSYTDFSEYRCAYNIIPLSAIDNPPGEFQAVEDDIIIPLNNVIRAKANEHNWDVIDVQNNANVNGLCVCPNSGGYFWSFVRAIAKSDVNFTSHPNAEGYKSIYRDDIANYLENKYYSFSERYPLRFLFNNARIPNCNAFVELYTTRLKLANTRDFSHIKPTKLENTKTNFLAALVASKNPKSELFKAKQKQQLLNIKQQKIAKAKLKRLVRPVAKTNIKKRMAKIESSKAYKNWVNAKTPKEKEKAYAILAEKMNANKPIKKKVIKKSDLKTHTIKPIKKYN